MNRHKGGHKDGQPVTTSPLREHSTFCERPNHLCAHQFDGGVDSKGARGWECDEVLQRQLLRVDALVDGPCFCAEQPRFLHDKERLLCREGITGAVGGLAIGVESLSMATASLVGVSNTSMVSSHGIHTVMPHPQSWHQHSHGHASHMAQCDSPSLWCTGAPTGHSGSLTCHVPPSSHAMPSQPPALVPPRVPCPAEASG